MCGDVSLFMVTCLMCSARCPQAQEKQRLVEQLSGLNAAHAEEVQSLRAEVQRLREVARDSQVQQLQERLAELERLSMKSCLSQEVEELRQVSLSVWGMLRLCWGSQGPGHMLCPTMGCSLENTVPIPPLSRSAWQRWKPQSCSWGRRRML